MDLVLAPRRSPRSSAATTLVGVLVILGVSACGSSSGSGDVPTTVPQTPLAAPPLASGVGAPPAGTVTPAAAATRLVLDAAGHRLVALGTDGSTLVEYSVTDPVSPRVGRTIRLPAVATAIAVDPSGTVLAAVPDAVIRVDAATGALDRTPTPIGRPLAVAAASDGDVLVGGDDGRLVAVGRSGAVTADLRGFVRVDDIAVHPRRGRDDQVVVLDRAQSSVTSVDLADGAVGEALRAGDGATNVVADPYGRFLVTDTRGGEFLGFYGDPLVARFRYPVAAGAFAVGYDDVRNLAWVSSGGDNRLTAFDLASGIPEQRAQHATVAQTDAIAVDGKTGTVYLISARGDGLQSIR